MKDIGDLAFAEAGDDNFHAFYLYDPTQEDVEEALVGGITVEKRGSGYTVGDVWARHGYGPLMYLIALDYTGPVLGLKPNHEISDEAQSVWNRFKHDGQPKRWDRNEAVDYFLPVPGSRYLRSARSKEPTDPVFDPSELRQTLRYAVNNFPS